MFDVGVERDKTIWVCGRWGNVGRLRVKRRLNRLNHGWRLSTSAWGEGKADVTILRLEKKGAGEVIVPEGGKTFEAPAPRSIRA